MLASDGSRRLRLQAIPAPADDLSGRQAAAVTGALEGESLESRIEQPRGRLTDPHESHLEPEVRPAKPEMGLLQRDVC